MLISPGWHCIRWLEWCAGPGVTRFKKGDEVSGASNGAYAEFAVAEESELALKPKSIEHVHAAGIF